MTVGIGPNSIDGPELIDGSWMAGLSQGQNLPYQSVMAHIGGGQASATQINVTSRLVAVTAAASAGDSVRLPRARRGMVKMVANATANSVNIFGYNASDTINGTVGSTAYALAGGAAVSFFCPKDGVWGATLTAGGSGGGDLPAPPSGFAYIINADGKHIVNANGSYILAKV